jgi:hypoxanthine phosphoribosyltransferase
MISKQTAQQYLDTAELICSAETVSATVDALATEINAVLAEKYPLVLSVMGGAVVFSGQLLPRLQFPLNYDFIHVTRYNDQLTGGKLDWKVFPENIMQGRVVLVLDDILDEGVTLAAIQQRVMASGASEFYSAVFADKDIGDQPKSFKADFVGLTLPNRYVFGFGMDIHGAWRNLPAIYALKTN